MFQGGAAYLGHQFSMPSAVRSMWITFEAVLQCNEGVKLARGLNRSATQGTFLLCGSFLPGRRDKQRRLTMHGLIYLIGLIVVIMFILSLLGLR
jgi:hypothetical protein